MDNDNKNGFIYMMIFIMGFLLLVNFSTANTLESYGTKKINEQFSFCQICSDANYVTLSSIDTPNSTVNINTNMTPTGSGQFCYNYTPTQVGRYDFRGISNGCTNTFATYVEVTNTGKSFNLQDIYIYLFFLLVCLFLSYLSYRLIANNPISKDPITNSQLYQIKKQNEFLYLLKVLKTKLYLVGIIGIYISILLFSTFLDQLTFSLGLNELNNILNNVNILLGWGLIPLVIGCIVYVIIIFYRTTVDVMRYQFGGFMRNESGVRR